LSVSPSQRVEFAVQPTGLVSADANASVGDRGLICRLRRNRRTRRRRNVESGEVVGRYEVGKRPRGASRDGAQLFVALSGAIGGPRDDESSAYRSPPTVGMLVSPPVSRCGS
jgi:hypothetical protein